MHYLFLCSQQICEEDTVSYPHCGDEESEAQKVSNLPTVTLLTSGSARAQIQVCLTSQMSMLDRCLFFYVFRLLGFGRYRKPVYIMPFSKY